MKSTQNPRFRVRLSPAPRSGRARKGEAPGFRGIHPWLEYRQPDRPVFGCLGPDPDAESAGDRAGAGARRGVRNPFPIPRFFDLVESPLAHLVHPPSLLLFLAAAGVACGPEASAGGRFRPGPARNVRQRLDAELYRSAARPSVCLGADRRRATESQRIRKPVRVFGPIGRTRPDRGPGIRPPDGPRTAAMPRPGPGDPGLQRGDPVENPGTVTGRRSDIFPLPASTEEIFTILSPGRRTP